MSSGKKSHALRSIQPLIRVVRGHRIILDADLAALYGVSTKRFNEQVNRNLQRFPSDFMFRLSKEECDSLRSQNATSKKSRGGRRYLPLVFTEHGAVMAANILNSKKAVQMSVFVVRAFLRMRTMLTDTKGLARQLRELEKKLTGRLDGHEAVIIDVLQRLTDLLDPPRAFPIPAKRPIGFHVR